METSAVALSICSSSANMHGLSKMFVNSLTNLQIQPYSGYCIERYTTVIYRISALIVNYCYLGLCDLMDRYDGLCPITSDNRKHLR